MREFKFKVWDKEKKCMRLCNSVHDTIVFDENGVAQYLNLQDGGASPHTYILIPSTRSA